MPAPKNKKPSFLRAQLANFFSASPQAFPLFLMLVFTTVLILVIRMKNIELDYAFNGLNLSIEKQNVENKDLKAERADLLSAKNLRKYAEKYDLNEPTEKQIIIIQK